MQPSANYNYDEYVFDYRNVVIEGYLDIDSKKSADLLKTAELGTYIIRPSSLKNEKGEPHCVLDVKEEAGVGKYLFKKNGNHYNFGQDVADLLDLIRIFKAMPRLPQSSLEGRQLTAYKAV